MEDKKRYEMIKVGPIQYHFFRLYTFIAKVPLLQFIQPYSHKEIYIGMKCVLNKLNKPPNYDLADFKGEDSKSI